MIGNTSLSAEGRHSCLPRVNECGCTHPPRKRVMSRPEQETEPAREASTPPLAGSRQTRMSVPPAHVGFTLVEVLAALMLIAIVLPAVMKGAAMATSIASSARRRNEAAGLAEEKLAEIIATDQWQTSSLSGDFGSDWPGYRWQATVQSWPEDTSGAGLQQVDLRVSWMARNKQDSLTLSTLAYAQTQTQTP